MKITKQGVTFDLKIGQLIWLWWWNRIDGYKYVTPAGNRFHSKEDYWLEVGSKAFMEVDTNDRSLISKKVRGYDFDHIIEMWSELYLKRGCWVVMYNINVQRKPASYWQLLQQSDRIAFLQDVVTLSCKDILEARRVCDSIDINFANALVIDCGEVVYNNEDLETLDDSFTQW